MVFRNPVTIEVGSLGTINIDPGEYCYAGSAMNGLDGRIRRHFAAEKKMHWHIDRLTTKADGMEAYISTSAEECTLSDLAVKCGCVRAVKGFGCSDCGCLTHLFSADAISKQKLLNSSGVVPFSEKEIRRR